MATRGPRIGDAASLWNFTPSPGWTKDECQILKLCLMKFGIGAWGQILSTGLLPGKLVGQLYGAAQRLLGQQSMAAFSGLLVDIDRVRTDNEAKLDAQRKAGLIIWSGCNPTKEMRLQWQAEAKAKYGLTPEQLQEVDEQLQEYVRTAIANGNTGVSLAPVAAAGDGAGAVAAAAAEGGDVLGCASEPASDADGADAAADQDILECGLEGLAVEQKCDLLERLRSRLQQLLACLVQRHCPHLAHLVTAPLPPPTTDAEAAALRELLALAAKPLPPAAELVASDVHRGQRLHVKQAAAARRAVPGRARLPPAPGAAAAGGRRKRAGGAGGASGADSDAGEGSKKRTKRSKDGSSGAGGRRSGRVGGSDVMRAALEAGIAQLMDMGFSRAKAKDALQEFDCDVEAAVEYLMQACM